jgi:hypothetical protein
VAKPPQKRVILNTFQDEAPPPFVILNLFQDEAPPSPVILKQVQDDDVLGLLDGWRFLHIRVRSAA